MNKKFKNFFESNGMTVTGNNAYGVLNGYEFNASVSMFDNVNPVKIHISYFATTEQKSAIESGLRNAAIKYLRYQSTPYGLYIGLNDITVNKLLKRLSAELDDICRIISDNGALGKDYDPYNGKLLEAETTTKANVDGLTINLDNESVTNINSVIDAENKDFNEAPQQLLKRLFRRAYRRSRRRRPLGNSHSSGLYLRILFGNRSSSGRVPLSKIPRQTK